MARSYGFLRVVQGRLGEVGMSSEEIGFSIPHYVCFLPVEDYGLQSQSSSGCENRPSRAVIGKTGNVPFSPDGIWGC